MTVTDAKAKQLLALCAVVVDAVRAAGDQGVPGGTLYAALMTVGCSLEQFEGLMRALVATRQVTRRGDLYFACMESTLGAVRLRRRGHQDGG